MKFVNFVSFCITHEKLIPFSFAACTDLSLTNNNKIVFHVYPTNLANNRFYYMAFQNSLFWLVDKRSVKTHIQTVARIFRIWTGVPDVVYLAGSFKLCIVVFLDVSPLQTCVSLKFTDKNFKQPNCFWLSMHAHRILLPSETDDSRLDSREKHMLTDSVQPYINRLLTSLVRSVLWNIRPLFFCMDLAPSSLGPY